MWLFSASARLCRQVLYIFGAMDMVLLWLYLLWGRFRRVLWKTIDTAPTDDDGYGAGEKRVRFMVEDLKGFAGGDENGPTPPALLSGSQPSAPFSATPFLPSNTTARPNITKTAILVYIWSFTYLYFACWIRLPMCSTSLLRQPRNCATVLSITQSLFGRGGGALGTLFTTTSHNER